VTAATPALTCGPAAAGRPDAAPSRQHVPHDLVCPTGGERVLPDVWARAAGRRPDRRQRRSRERYTGEPGTGYARPAGGWRVHRSRCRRPARLTCAPAAGSCWMCGQPGRADPPATVYFSCDGCDVRWHGGTGRRRHSPQFTQREFTWWIAGKLAHIPYIDHAAEHTASPA
jgi:hypothetical protein